MQVGEGDQSISGLCAVGVSAVQIILYPSFMCKEIAQYAGPRPP